ncbi:MAG: hypothetical protein M9899_10715 [Bdellovibrionaceae bacterium]|nr:hypothetical protein [Pseudobdellovibrionaceae bacterium]
MKTSVLFVCLFVLGFSFSTYAKLTPNGALQESPAQRGYYRVTSAQGLPVFGSTDVQESNICGWLPGKAFVEVLSTNVEGVVRLLISTPVVEIDSTINDCGLKNAFYILDSELAPSLFAE